MPLKEKVLDVIRSIQENKKKVRISPHYALYTEISCAIVGIAPSEIKQVLNALCKEKIISHGKTLNYLYFTIADH